MKYQPDWTKIIDFLLIVNFNASLRFFLPRNVSLFLDATKKLANKIRETLKIQQAKNEKNQEQDITKLSARQQTDLRLRLTQVASQSKRFQEVWSEYNDSQLNFRRKTKEVLIKQAKITGQTNLSNDEIEQMIGTVSTVLEFVA